MNDEALAQLFSERRYDELIDAASMRLTRRADDEFAMLMKSQGLARSGKLIEAMKPLELIARTWPDKAAFSKSLITLLRHEQYMRHARTQPAILDELRKDDPWRTHTEDAPVAAHIEFQQGHTDFGDDLKDMDTDIGRRLVVYGEGVWFVPFNAIEQAVFMFRTPTFFDDLFVPVELRLRHPEFKGIRGRVPALYPGSIGRPAPIGTGEETMFEYEGERCIPDGLRDYALSSGDGGQSMLGIRSLKGLRFDAPPSKAARRVSRPAPPKSPLSSPPQAKAPPRTSTTKDKQAETNALLTMTAFGTLRTQFDAGTFDQGSVQLAEGTFEMNYFVARSSLLMGANLEHGLRHLGECLAVAPGNAHLQSLLVEYANTPAGAKMLESTPASSSTLGGHIARACCLLAGGQLETGLRVLSALEQAKPGAGWIRHWAIPGFEGVANGGTNLNLDVALGALISVLQTSPPYPVANATDRALAHRWASVALAFDRRPMSQGEKNAMDMLVPGLLRKAGRFNEGLQRIKGNPSAYHRNVALGAMLRDAGDPDRAVDAYINAFNADRSRVETLLDSADTRLDQGRFKDAFEVYSMADSRAPGNPWAEASRDYAAWKMGTGSLDPVLQLARRGERRAIQLLGRESPYEGKIPEPTDAAVGALRNTLAQTSPSKLQSKVVDITSSNVESPSNAVLWKLICGADLKFKWTRVASPDPRKPLETLTHPVWKLEGEQLVPAVPPPRADVVHLVTTLSAVPFDVSRLWASASHHAATLDEPFARSL
ncbi:MAG: hypothetical protein AAF411_27635, partial [Myxococcota bacterium]